MNQIVWCKLNIKIEGKCTHEYWNEIVYIAIVWFKRSLVAIGFILPTLTSGLNYIEGKVFNHPFNFVSMALYMIYITYMIMCIILSSYILPKQWSYYIYDCIQIDICNMTIVFLRITQSLLQHGFFFSDPSNKMNSLDFTTN